MRRDGRGHRDDGELLPAEDLVTPSRDRLDRGGDDAEQHVAQAVDLRPGGACEIEGARAVMEESGVVDAERQRDGGVRLVPGRSDRVEAAPVLLQPARRVVGLPAVDLRPPELLDLVRRRAERRTRLERAERPDEVLLERIEVDGHRPDVGAIRRRPAAPSRRSTRRLRRARSSARGGRRRTARPRCCRRHRPTR